MGLEWLKDEAIRAKFRERDSGTPVPKRTDLDLPDWAQVALEGFDKWLRFWNIETYREHPLALKLVELGMVVPPPIEGDALRNLTRQALAMRGTRKMARSILDDTEMALWRLERFFMQYHGKQTFQRRYGVMNAEKRFVWIGRMTGMSEQLARLMLEEISLVVGEAIETEQEWEMDQRVNRTLETKNMLVVNMTSDQWRNMVRSVMKESA